MYNKIQINQRETENSHVVLHAAVLQCIYICRPQLTQPSGKGGTLAYLQEWLS